MIRSLEPVDFITGYLYDRDMTDGPPPAQGKILSLQYHCFPDEAGGAWRVTYEINRRLAQRGWTVHLITCNPGEELADRETIQGVVYDRIGVKPSKRPVSLWRALRRRLNAALSDSPGSPARVVHVHNPLVGFLALLNPRMWNVPMLYHFHSAWYDEEQVNRRERLLLEGRAGPGAELLFLLRLKLIRLMEWTCYCAARRILVLSRYSQERLGEYFPLGKDKVQVLPGGVDTGEFHPVTDSASRDALRARLGFPVDRPVLLTVRRLRARMGIETLIEAAKLLTTAQPEAEFLIVIAGRGPLAPRLEQLVRDLGVQDRVRLAGFVPQETLPLYYQAADLFVLPTESIEGFGMATLEALASGIPVMGTPVGGTVEILQSIDDRLLFKSTEARAIADGLAGFLQDPESYRALGRQGRQIVEDRYDWEPIVTEMERCLQSLVRADKR